MGLKFIQSRLNIPHPTVTPFDVSRLRLRDEPATLLIVTFSGLSRLR